MSKITFDALFVRYHNAPSKKNPAKQSIGVLLANGMETKYFPTKLTADYFTDFDEGQKVEVEMDVNPFNDFDREVTSVE